ncbi:MAG: hypothetical protein MI923_15265 [Phycisphaerales bacterium]|nr:hypothetical protein [Phycisphaerales bacterium]
MARMTFPSFVLIATTLLFLDQSAVGQDAVANPSPSTRPASQPAESASMQYEVINVQRGVYVSTIGVDPKLKAGWRPVKVGDLLIAGEQIRTGMRARVKLVARPATPPTVLMLESGTLMSIDELAKIGGTHKSRIGLRYGAVRAGVAEGQVRSDMEITCPVATLSKKGTDIFRIEYNLNGRFNMSLSERGRGLLQAIQLEMNAKGDLLRTRSRFMTPGQFVTQRMLQAIDNVQFDREINVNDIFGLGDQEQVIALLNDRGLGFLFPQGTNLSNFTDTSTTANQTGIIDDGGDGTGGILTIPQGQMMRTLRGGDFGIGQGLIPGIFGSGAMQRQILQARGRCQMRNHPACKQQSRPRR